MFIHFFPKDKIAINIINLMLFIGLILLNISVLYPNISMARESKCPKPPGADTLMLTTSYYPILSSTVSSEASNTSGCQKGKPSDRFYRPRGALYLEEMLEQVTEEVAKGQGEHLEVLAQLVGCESQSYPMFVQTLQNHYPQLFESTELSSAPPSAGQIWENINTVVSENPSLSNYCQK